MNQEPQKTAAGDVDIEILSLFPSLDFNRSNVHAQKRKRMKTNLVVLKKAAENGYVTKYMLTNENASPRMGGQVAQDALKELGELGLLAEKQTTSEKGTLRKDKVLTPKGIIACMAFFKFQKTDHLKQILERPCYKGSNLAYVLKLFNRFVRAPYIVEPSISRSMAIVKRGVTGKGLVGYGFNLELKSEDDISKDLRAIEEAEFVESMRLNPFEFAGMLPGILNPQDEKKNKLIQSILEYWKKHPAKPVDSEKMENITRVGQTLYLSMCSPESIAWAKSSLCETVTPEKLMEAVDQRLLESKVEFKDPLERLEHELKTMRELMMEMLVQDGDWP